MELNEAKKEVADLKVRIAELGTEGHESYLLGKETMKVIKEMEAELEKNILVMDATSAQARQRDIENHKRRLARSQQEAREDYNLRRNEELAKLQALVREVIVEIARAGGFDLVVEQAVYVSDAINITDLVLERLAELP